MAQPRTASVVEVAAVRPPAGSCDVAILGGGLAGLTLSIQIKQARPDTSVVVLEKRAGPAPLAAFKVGESTVSSGAHYFAVVVGVKEHLEKDQLIKCGLRYWLPADGNRDITKRSEKGPRDWPPHDNYQIDRGLFENFLAARARQLGVDVMEGVRVQDVALDDPHRVSYEMFGREASLDARWVVDAAGRASLLKKQLGLGTDSGHYINSAWIRLGRGLDLEKWGADDPAFMATMSKPGLRQYSTNHLFGEGYWMWLIPLSSGPISIGVCADPRFHPFEQINEFDRFLAWLHEHEPQVGAEVASRVGDVEDFLRVEDYAYGVEQTYSKERWSLVGEAAAFADPLYSPGSDFIGYGNTFTTDLVTRDLDGEDISERVDHYNALYQRVFEHVISRYRDSYPIFGNPGVALGLLSWDGYSNHNGIVFAFVKNKLSDFEFMKRVDDDLDRLFRLNINMHKLFRQWNELGYREAPSGPPGGVPGGAPGGPPTDGPPPGVGRPAGGPPPGFGGPPGERAGGPPGGPPPGVGPPSGLRGAGARLAQRVLGRKGPPPGVGRPPGGPPPGVGGPPGGPPPGVEGARAGGAPGGPPGGGPPPLLRLLTDVLDTLVRDFPDDDALAQEIRDQVRASEALAVSTFHNAAGDLPGAPPPDTPINPYAVGLDPEAWESDGLFEGPGLTLDQAMEVVTDVVSKTETAEARPG